MEPIPVDASLMSDELYPDDPDDRRFDSSLLAHAYQSRRSEPKPVLKIAIECDQKCKNKFSGDSSSAKAAAAEEYIEALIAGINTIFERDINRGIQISHIRIWEGPSPFDGGVNSLQSTFKEYYKTNMQGMPCLSMRPCDCLCKC